MTYEVIILGHLHMPLYFIGTFTEYSLFDFLLWALRDSNPRPSGCKPDALNQLS